MRTRSLWTNKEAEAVHTWINTTKCFVSRLIVKAAFEKECNYYVIGELSERTAKQSSSVWWSAICSNVCRRERGREKRRDGKTVMWSCSHSLLSDGINFLSVFTNHTLEINGRDFKHNVSWWMPIWLCRSTLCVGKWNVCFYNAIIM